MIGAAAGRADPRHQHRASTRKPRPIALAKGMIIADTKFEFGLDDAGTLVLMDEVLTPDSSRYWPVEGYDAAFAAGANPPSYDKQFVRDWLEAGAHQRQALGQDAAGAALAAGRDREDGRQVPRSAAAPHRLKAAARAGMARACFSSAPRCDRRRR